MKPFLKIEKKIIFAIFLSHQRDKSTQTLLLCFERELIRLPLGGIQPLSLVSRQVKGQTACHTFTGSSLGKEKQSISAWENIILISNLPLFPLLLLPAPIIIRQLHIKNVIWERENKL